MAILPELEPVTPHALLWHAYDPSVKADLFSTALTTSENALIIDPILPDATGLEQLRATKRIRGIIVTNQNHWRGSLQLSQQLAVPIFAHSDSALPEISVKFSPIADGDSIEDQLRVVTIQGAAPGEIAIWCDVDDGIVVIGDALINFEPYGFGLLPPKYCVDQKMMRASLERLLDYQFNRMFFGHGFPIMTEARARLESLLNSA